MTDVMREMIAQLMGGQRAEEEGRNLPPYDHHSVCRAYLLDCCPREILLDTRLENMVTCRKMHECALRSDYQKAQEKKDHFYEIEAFEALEEAVKTIDYEVEKVREKIKKDNDSFTDTHDFMKSQKINELNEKIATTLAEMETLGNEGKVHESVELSRTVNDLQRKKQELENEVRGGLPMQQRLRVCEACGAQLNSMDHESRLADHYGGKMHLGMVTIREKYQEMKKVISDRRQAKRDFLDKQRAERKAGLDQDEKKDGDRDRRERDRGDRRDRDRDRKRSRSPRRRHRSRSRSRSPRRHHRNDRDRRRY